MTPSTAIVVAATVWVVLTPLVPWVAFQPVTPWRRAWTYARRVAYRGRHRRPVVDVDWWLTRAAAGGW